MNIGLLEDNPSILDYMKIALEMAGYKVTTYFNSSSLLDALFAEADISATLPFDLVIIDLLLPGKISGLETISRIQQAFPQEKLSIIVISASSQDDLDQLKVSLPHIPFLRKPFKMSALLQLIDEMKRP